MKKLTLLLLLLGTQAFAMKEYYNITRSIRALGMGGAFYGLSDDEYALFYNPAGLAQYRGSWEFEVLGINAQVAPDLLNAISTIQNLKGNGGSSSTADLANQLQKYSNTPLFGAIGLDFLTFHMKNFGIGLLLADTKFDLSILGKDFATSVDVTAISDTGLVFGYADHVTDDLAVGVNGKFLARIGGHTTFSVEDIAQGNKFNVDPGTIGGGGAGMDFDLGGTYDVHGLPFGVVNRASLSLNNLLGTDFPWARKTAGAPPGLPRMLSLGWFTAFPGYGVIDNFLVDVDFAEFGIGGQPNDNVGGRDGAFFKHVNLGAEVPMLGFLALRAGVHQGYFTAGLGLNGRGVKLDFATYADELFSAPGRLASRRYAIKLTFGFFDPPPPPFAETASVREAAPLRKESKPLIEPIPPQPGEAAPATPPAGQADAPADLKAPPAPGAGKATPKKEVAPILEEPKYTPPGESVSPAKKK